MSAIQQAIIASSGGSAPPSLTFGYVSQSTTSEGSTVYAYYNYSNFSGETVYWTVYSDLARDNNWDTATSGSTQLYGTGQGWLVLTPKADGVTEGTWQYGIRFGTQAGYNDYIETGMIYYVNDTSTTASTTLLLDLDPASLPGSINALQTWGDTSGKGFDASLHNAVKSADFGGTLIFNGTSTYAEIPELRTSGYESLSISTWIKCASISGTQTILAKELQYKLRVTGTGSVNLLGGHGGGWQVNMSTSAGVITAGTWYHVAATIDVSHASIYINGVLVTQQTGVVLDRTTAQFPFLIGAYANNDPASDFLHGVLGEVKVWNYALNDSDVLTEFNNAKTRYLPPTYSFGGYGLSVDEGSSITVNVTTANVPDGTTLYWTIPLSGVVVAGDFVATSGSFNISSNSGSITINPRADGLTEGGQAFRVQVRTGSTSGTVVLLSDQITINDTSSGTTSRISYVFPGAIELPNRVYNNVVTQEYNSTNVIQMAKAGIPQPLVGWRWKTAAYDPYWRTITNVVDNTDYWTVTINPGGSGPALTTGILMDNANADWNLGKTWTIEFWVKPTVVPGRNGAPGDAQRIISQNTDATNGFNNLDIGFTNGIIEIANTAAGFDAPAEMVGVWSHVAVSSNNGDVQGYINGQRVYNYPGLNVNFTNGNDDLYVGQNGARTGANQQSFSGQLTDIRISNIARYSGTSFNPFSVSHPPTRDSNTKLLLTPTENSPFGSESAHYLIYSGVQLAVDYPVGGQSLGFNGTDNHYVQIAGTKSDWALGDTYTIEWWENLPDASSNTFYSIMCQTADSYNIDIFHNNGYINMCNADIQITQPTFGQWNHIALQKDGSTFKAYINGVDTAPARANNTTLSNSSLDLVIGSRTSDGGSNFYGQYFKGQLANIMISSVARYSGTFTPSKTLTVDANTKLALNGAFGSSGMLVDASPSAHTVTNHSATIDLSFPG